MASSHLYLLPFLSVSTVLCGLWVAQVPARAEVQVQVKTEPLAALNEQVNPVNAANDSVKSVGLEMSPAAKSTPKTLSFSAESPIEAANSGLEDSAKASADNNNQTEPTLSFPNSQTSPVQTPDLAPQKPSQPPSINFTSPQPSTLDFNAPTVQRSPQDLLTDYVLGPGDQIVLLVLGYDEFTGARVVLPDGTITMPLIGSVSAAGRTVAALAQDVQSRLKVYLTDPVVDANLTVLRPVVVNIAGEVYRPGPVQLSSLTQVNTVVNPSANITNATNTPTLSSALTAAGGIKRTANIRDIVIQRRLPNGGARTFTVNLWEALVSGQDPGIFVLADGDSVYVPVAQSGENLDQRVIASSSFAPTNVRVRVVGEVQRPGEVTVQPNSSISSAIAAAGGPNMDTAQLQGVTLVRLNQEGQIEKKTVDLSNLIDNDQIQDGDVVVVPKRGYLNALDAVGRIFSPLLAPFGIFNTIDNLFR